MRETSEELCMLWGVVCARICATPCGDVNNNTYICSTDEKCDERHQHEGTQKCYRYKRNRCACAQRRWVTGGRTGLEACIILVVEIHTGAFYETAILAVRPLQVSGCPNHSRQICSQRVVDAFGSERDEFLRSWSDAERRSRPMMHRPSVAETQESLETRTMWWESSANWTHQICLGHLHLGWNREFLFVGFREILVPERESRQVAH